MKNVCKPRAYIWDFKVFWFAEGERLEPLAKIFTNVPKMKENYSEMFTCHMIGLLWCG